MQYAAEGIEELLSELRALVDQQAPELRGAFESYAAEAVFARRWLAPHLSRLGPDAKLLEVGAGAMLVSTQLAREGYEVAALEPIGSGFSALRGLQAVVRGFAQSRGIRFRVLPVGVEELAETECYDLAFSLNVMEHVSDVETALLRVTRALKPEASYAFICPNYLFPYEPHFGVPIVGSKTLTGRLFGRWILGSRRVLDPKGTWESLNWISPPVVNRTCRQLPGIRWRYNRNSFSDALERVTWDAEFASRRAGWMRGMASLLVSSRLHRLARLIPTSLQPLIDCTIVVHRRGD